MEGGQAAEAAEVDVSTTARVRAAGGIVLRRAPDGGWEVLLVHRPRHRDWSFPKGKADPGERDEETALREVEEETGLRCALGEPVGRTRYRDAAGRDKVVHYWLMQPEVRDGLADGAFVPNDEVDEIRWCSLAEAARCLTYVHDRALLAEAPLTA
jgi:8-oxo-dGTP diphosphatase